MNVDRTTKVLMALIALFLGIIAFKLNPDSAQAQNTTQTNYDHLEVLGTGYMALDGRNDFISIVLNKKTGSVSLLDFCFYARGDVITRVRTGADKLRLTEGGELQVGEFEERK